MPSQRAATPYSRLIPAYFLPEAGLAGALEGAFLGAGALAAAGAFGAAGALTAAGALVGAGLLGAAALGGAGAGAAPPDDCDSLDTLLFE